MKFLANYVNLTTAPLPLLPPPPVISLVQAVEITEDSCSIEVTSSGLTGTVYAVLLPAAAPAPSRAQIQAGTDGADAPAVWADSTPIYPVDTYNIDGGPSGLTYQSYKAYAVHFDAYGNYSTVVASATFTPLFNTLSLFDETYTGFWFDVSRTDLIFRGNSGATAISPEQPTAILGNVINFMFNLVELAGQALDDYVDGLAETVITGWVNGNFEVFSALGDDLTAEKTSASGTTWCTSDTTVTLTTNAVYTMEFEVAAVTGNPVAAFRSGTNARSSSVPFNTTGPKRIYLISTGGASPRPGFSAVSPASFTVTSASWRALSGIHAGQSPFTAWPALDTIEYALKGATNRYLLTGYKNSATQNSIIARVKVPATIAATMYVMGSMDTGSVGRLCIGFNTSGHLIGGVGLVDETVIKDAVDHRGQTITIALRHDADSWHLDVDGDEKATGALASAPATNDDMWLLTRNNNGAQNGNFIDGLVYHFLAIKRFLTEAQSLQIHNEWTT